ncbi:MAG: T9SS type A sorting domain-containing protein [Flavobacteriales bacterium]|nr:T9SS type A sorting domain-containing protein [Flavobacteriales bacterium]
MKRLLPIFLLALLCACDFSLNTEITHPHRESFSKRKVNIKRAIFKNFTIADSLEFRTEYDRKEKINLIMNGEGDTLCMGYLSKHKELWVFSEQLEKGYSIWGFEADGDSIKGWLERKITAHAISDAFVEAGLKDPLDSTLLTADNELLVSVLRKQLDSYDYLSLKRSESQEQDERSGSDLASADAASPEILEALFPNPAATELNLSFSSDTVAFVTIYDMSGSQIFKQACEGTEHQIDVSSFENGRYILAIQDVADRVIGQEQLVVAH